MPTEMLTRDERRLSPTLLPVDTPPPDKDELGAVARQVRRVRRLKIKAAAFALGTALTTGLWVLHEWQASGGFERFAHENNPGDWNPTLPAVIVGIWGLIVGIGALRVYFERPPIVAEVDREIARLRQHAAVSDAPARLRHLAWERIERVGRLRFHVAAWVLGMIVLTPLNALIEWQDNGAFERFSSNSRPGSWDPWVLYVGGIWAAVVALFALWAYLGPKDRVTHGRHRPRFRLRT